MDDVELWWLYCDSRMLRMENGDIKYAPGVIGLAGHTKYYPWLAVVGNQQKVQARLSMLVCS